MLRAMRGVEIRPGVEELGEMFDQLYARDMRYKNPKDSRSGSEVGPFRKTKVHYH